VSPELLRVIEEDHEALAAFAQGNPEPKKRLYSREDDATLANPLGPPVRGWAHIAPVLQHAAGSLRDGRIAFERVSDYEVSELAYTVDIERYSVRVIGRGEELSDIALRVTTIFRRESGEWRVVHRHADPITTPRPHESMLEQ
jgi:ketosteroid isomerase-like protein